MPAGVLLYTSFGLVSGRIDEARIAHRRVGTRRAGWARPCSHHADIVNSFARFGLGARGARLWGVSNLSTTHRHTFSHTHTRGNRRRRTAHSTGDKCHLQVATAEAPTLQRQSEQPQPAARRAPQERAMIANASTNTPTEPGKNQMRTRHPASGLRRGGVRGDSGDGTHSHERRGPEARYSRSRKLASTVELERHLWCSGHPKPMHNYVVSSILRVLYVSKSPIGP